jgi:hypothetical protein
MPLITFWSKCLGHDDEWIGLFLPLWFNSFNDFTLNRNSSELEFLKSLWRLGTEEE